MRTLLGAGRSPGIFRRRWRSYDLGGALQPAVEATIAAGLGFGLGGAGFAATGAHGAGASAALPIGFVVLAAIGVQAPGSAAVLALGAIGAAVSGPMSVAALEAALSAAQAEVTSLQAEIAQIKAIAAASAIGQILGIAGGD